MIRLVLFTIPFSGLFLCSLSILTIMDWRCIGIQLNFYKFGKAIKKAKNEFKKEKHNEIFQQTTILSLVRS